MYCAYYYHYSQFAVSKILLTGGSAALPPIPGLKEAPYLTNSSVFNLTELPERTVIIGAGAVGLELAQALARFGSKVTVLVRSDKVYVGKQMIRHASPRLLCDVDRPSMHPRWLVRVVSAVVGWSSVLQICKELHQLLKSV
jgi:thioredoxin reductase